MPLSVTMTSEQQTWSLHTALFCVFVSFFYFGSTPYSNSLFCHILAVSAPKKYSLVSNQLHLYWKPMNWQSDALPPELARSAHCFVRALDKIKQTDWHTYTNMQTLMHIRHVSPLSSSTQQMDWQKLLLNILYMNKLV